MFKGFRWIVENPNDTIQSCHMNGEFFEIDDLIYISNQIKSGDVILDIGANVGNHAIYLSKETEASKIIVIEPVEKIYKILLANVALNYAHNIDLNYIGIGLGHTNTVGYPFMTYGGDNLGATQISPSPVTDLDISLTFPPVTIMKGDDLFADTRIHFIKIDVETMEMFVLEGLKQTIDKNKPKIYIEVSRQNLDNFKIWLEQNSYEIKHEIFDKDAKEIYSNYFVVPVS